MNSKLVAEKDKVVRKFVLYDYSKTVMQPSGAKDLHTFKVSKFYRLYKDFWYDFQVVRDRIKVAMNDPSNVSFYKGQLRFHAAVDRPLEGKLLELVEVYFHLSGWELTKCNHFQTEYAIVNSRGVHTSTKYYHKFNLTPREGLQNAVPN